MEIGCRICEVGVVIWPEKALNFRFWPKIPSQFRRRPFFLRSPGFALKKRLSFREIPSQFTDKPYDSDSGTMKIWFKVVCSFLTLSKKPSPPFSNPS